MTKVNVKGGGLNYFSILCLENKIVSEAPRNNFLNCMWNKHLENISSSLYHFSYGDQHINKFSHIVP